MTTTHSFPFLWPRSFHTRVCVLIINKSIKTNMKNRIRRPAAQTKFFIVLKFVNVWILRKFQMISSILLLFLLSPYNYCVCSFRFLIDFIKDYYTNELLKNTFDDISQGHKVVCWTRCKYLLRFFLPDRSWYFDWVDLFERFIESELKK